MAFYTDQLNRTIELTAPPKRIVSLVPSQTEFLAALGLDAEVVGITRFCIHPEHWCRNKQRVGGTKDFKTELIRSLQPDLIIANKEENDPVRLHELMSDIPVWVSDVNDLDSACAMMEAIGEMCDKRPAAEQLVTRTRSAFEELHRTLQLSERKKSVVYLIWNDPFMAAGSDTFIHNMLSLCGLHVLPEQLERYPQLSIEDLRQLRPNVLLLSSEPFPFAENHRQAMASLLPETKVLLCDGEFFSWYGARLQSAPAYFSSLLLEIQGA